MALPPMAIPGDLLRRDPGGPPGADLGVLLAAAAVPPLGACLGDRVVRLSRLCVPDGHRTVRQPVGFRWVVGQRPAVRLAQGDTVILHGH